MVVNILCLHGMGTNSDIFETQLGSVTRFLPEHYNFEFYDGEEESEPAPEIKDVHQGPYFSYYLLPTEGNVRASHDYLNRIISEDGPFDGVIGFSQGGAVAAGLILRHQIEHPFAPPLFRFAIFICSALPFSWSDNYGVDITELLRATDTESESEQMLKYRLEHLHERWVKSTRLRAGQPAPPPTVAASEFSESTIRSFYPDHDKIRIKIPTGHIFGKLDSYRSQSGKLMELCTESMVTSYEHPGGHDIPRRRDVSKKIQEVIEKVVTRGEFVH